MSTHREEHEHPIGKVVGVLGRGVTADWMAVAMVLTESGRITHRNVEAFNCSEEDARTNLVGMLAEAFAFASAQYQEIMEAKTATVVECRSIVEQANA